MDNTLEWLGSIMERGGPVMWPIALCSLLTVFITLRKFLQWGSYMLHVYADAGAWETLLKTLPSGDEAARKAALKASHSPYARIVAKAFAPSPLTPAEQLEAAAHAEVRRLARGLGLLDTIVTLAPMLGILGTVTGIITSFTLMGTSGTEDPTGIAAGIAEALITTAAGLIVSMVALLPLNFGRVWHRHLVLHLQQAMTAVEKVLPKPEPTDATP